MSLTIDDLLESLQDPTGGLTGSFSEIWKRIANRDSFDELSVDGDEKEELIKEWIEANPYSNI
jgi:hypothetical protein